MGQESEPARRVRRVLLSLGAAVCAVGSSGSVWCAGLRGSSGEREYTSGLEELVGLDALGGLGGSALEVCALSLEGRVRCTGAVTEGVDLGAREQLTDVVDLGNGGDHVCALTRGGEVVCWGLDRWIEIAGRVPAGWLLGPAHARHWNGENVTIARQVQSMAIGTYQLCLLRNGAVQCGGNNTWGECGDGPFDITGVFREVRLEGPALAVSVGGHLSCALVADGVWCWGQLGPRRCSTDCGWQTAEWEVVACRTGTPTHVLPMPDDDRYRWIEGDRAQMCALSEDQRLFCWDPAERAPVPELIGTGVVDFAIHYDSLCYLTENGSLTCRGSIAETLHRRGAPGNSLEVVLRVP